MKILYEKGNDVLKLLEVSYDGGRCEVHEPVPDFIENLEVFSEWGDGPPRRRAAGRTRV